MELAVQSKASKVIDFFVKDYKDEQSNTLLHLVLQKAGLMRFLPLLLDEGANVLTQNANGDVALHVAIEESLVPQAREIMKKMSNYSVKNKRGKTPLHLVALKDLYVLIDELVHGGINVNDKDKEGNTPLFIASSEGNVASMKELIKEGADVNAKNIYGDTLLHSAVSKGHLNAVKELIKAGANADVKDNNSKTSLDLAIGAYQLGIVLELIEAGGNNFFDFIDQQIKSLCRKVSAQQSQDDIKRFITFIQDLVKESLKNDVLQTFSSTTIKGNVLEYLDYYVGLLSNEMKKMIEVGSGSQQTLCPTAKENYLDMLKVFKLDLEFFYVVYKLSNKFFTTNKVIYDIYTIKVIMDMSKQIDKNSRIGYYYAWSNNLDEVKSFLQQGNSSVNAVDKYGYTLLDWAVLGGSFEVMSFLVDKGYDINFQTAFFGTKPIHFAAVKGPCNIVEFFTSKGVSVDELDGNNLTPLFYAVSAGNLDMVDCLIGKGASINAKDKNGRKLMYYASVYNKNKDVMELLISKGLSVNKTDKDGLTPIHYASRDGNFNMVKCLAEKGANVNAKDYEGFSPAHLAAVKGSLDIVKYLAERGANMNYHNIPHRDRVIEGAAQHNHVDIVKYLVEERGIDFNVQDVHGDRTLNDAAYFNSVDVIEYLLSKGADIEEQDYSGHTPLHDAVNNNAFDAVKCLVEKGANVEARDKRGRKPIDLVKDYRIRQYLQQAAKGSRHRRDIFVNDYIHLQHEPFYIDFTDQTKLAASSGTRPSSWISDLFSWMKSSVGGLLNPKPEEISSAKDSISQIDAPMDVNGTIMLLDLLIRRVTGQKYVSTVDQPISPLEAQGYTLNITKRFEKVVEQAALKSGISMHRLNIDYMGMQKEITKKVMSGKFNEISGILKSYVEKACPGEEFGKLSPKKFEKFIAQFNKGLLNQSIEQILHNRDGTLEVYGAKQMSLEPQSYLSNASVQGHSKDKVSTCLSDIEVTKLVNNLSR